MLYIVGYILIIGASYYLINNSEKVLNYLLFDLTSFWLFLHILASALISILFAFLFGYFINKIFINNNYENNFSIRISKLIKYFKNEYKKINLRYILIGVFLIFGILKFTSYINNYFNMNTNPFTEKIFEYAGGSILNLSILALFAVIMGVLEEILFRGIVFSKLKNKLYIIYSSSTETVSIFKNTIQKLLQFLFKKSSIPYITALIIGIIFSLFHIFMYSSIKLIGIALVGFILGIIRYKYGLISSILTHSIYNLIGVILMFNGSFAILNASSVSIDLPKKPNILLKEIVERGGGYINVYDMQYGIAYFKFRYGLRNGEEAIRKYPKKFKENYRNLIKLKAFIKDESKLEEINKTIGKMKTTMQLYKFNIQNFNEK